MWKSCKTVHPVEPGQGSRFCNLGPPLPKQGITSTVGPLGTGAEGTHIRLVHNVPYMCSRFEWLQERWFSPDADMARRPGEKPQPGSQVRRFLPFGDGSRKCIGGELGRVSLTATLARVFGNYRFSLAEKVSPLSFLSRRSCLRTRYWRLLPYRSYWPGACPSGIRLVAKARRRE